MVAAASAAAPRQRPFPDGLPIQFAAQSLDWAAAGRIAEVLGAALATHDFGSRSLPTSELVGSPFAPPALAVATIGTAIISSPNGYFDKQLPD